MSVPSKVSIFERSIRHALIDRDMNVSDLASALGISPAYLYDILKDARRAVAQRKRICEFLGLDELIAGKEDNDETDHDNQ